MKISCKRHALQSAALFAAATVFGAAAATGQLSLETLFSPDANERVEFAGSPASFLQWTPEGGAFLLRQVEGDAFRPPLTVDVETGSSSDLFDFASWVAALSALEEFSPEDVETMSSDDVQLGPDLRSLLVTGDSDLFHYSIRSDSATRLTADSTPEEIARFSPDGTQISFIREHDLYVVQIDGGGEKALTQSGSPTLLNGKLDWVYQEEIYGRGDFKAYWWSPDSRALAFLELDESPVPSYTLVDHLETRSRTEIVHYPKAGDPNPQVRLGITHLDGGQTVWVDTQPYFGSEFLIVRVDWTPDSRRLVFLVQDRQQTWLDINLADPHTGAMQTLVHETSPAFVDVDLTGAPHWLSDGTFLWLSGRSGQHHLHHFDSDGTLLKKLTDGNWEVRTLHGLDATTGWVYFTASEHSPIEDHLYRIRLDGGGLARLSSRSGHHSVRFDPAFRHYLDTWSDIDTPPRLTLHAAGGELVRTVDENAVPALDEIELPPVEFLQVPAADGFVFEAALIRPPDFDASRTYPVLQYNYGGPHAQTVRNRWSGNRHLWLRYLAQRGFVIWMCDNRSASGKGIAPTWETHGRLGELELADLESCLGWLRQQPWVDDTRIGLYGGSFGGFMSAFALTHSRSFKAGIAFAPVTDWRLYDSIYTERYMGLPRDNPQGYEATSVVEAASRLHGRLLLIHGTMDDNVHLQNTIQLAHALQQAGKSFQLMLYPDSRHGITNQAQIFHLYTLMTRFLDENL